MQTKKDYWQQNYWMSQEAKRSINFFQRATIVLQGYLNSSPFYHFFYALPHKQAVINALNIAGYKEEAHKNINDSKPYIITLLSHLKAETEKEQIDPNGEYAAVFELLCEKAEINYDEVPVFRAPVITEVKEEPKMKVEVEKTVEDVKSELEQQIKTFKTEWEKAIKDCENDSSSRCPRKLIAYQLLIELDQSDLDKTRGALINLNEWSEDIGEAFERVNLCVFSHVQLIANTINTLKDLKEEQGDLGSSVNFKS